MKGLSSEEQILSEVMTPLIRQDARVLIGGSADAGVLCSLGRIYGPAKAAFTVVDKCRSPLELIREFAAEKQVLCRTLNADILDLDGSEQWDQIVLHYTANFVDADHREKFLARIAQALAPGGTLVCAVKTGEKVFSDPESRRPPRILVGSAYRDTGSRDNASSLRVGRNHAQAEHIDACRNARDIAQRRLARAERPQHAQKISLL
jgi:SAM-dependent methyltransferase